MSKRSVQQAYPENYQYCYGCGPLNDNGLHISSDWRGDECVCTFEPKSFQTAFPGCVYGGLIASIIDCHSMGTAAGARAAQDGRSLDEGEADRFVTAQLNVTYVKPTPLGATLEVRARAREIKGRKVIVDSKLLADGVECARGEVVAIQIPDDLIDDA